MTNPADPDCCCGLSEPAAVVLHQDETAVSLAVRGEIDMDNAGHLSHLIGAVLARVEASRGGLLARMRE